MLDARTLLEAFEYPIYIDRAGKKITGVPLSHVQYERVLVDLHAAGEDRAATDAVLKQALTDMKLPADEILALPDPIFWAAIKDFFRCCRGEKLETVSPAATPTP
jgi:hypothetical protein